MKKNKTLYLTQAAMIAALYVVLTSISNSVGLASGVIQVRLSEALTVLPIFTPAAIPGLFIGCFFANLFTGSTIIDIVFGSLTTLAAAATTYKLRNHAFLSILPPILYNAIVIPLVLKFGYIGIEDTLPFLILTVGIGQIISCGGLGAILIAIFKKYKGVLFSSKDIKTQKNI